MLPFRNGRARRVLVLILIATNALAFSAVAQQQKKAGHKKSLKEAASPSATPEAGSQVPLPVGHEAKGLVFPDIDENGHLRGRFVAGTARRLDQDHMEFRDLKITTYTETNQTDLEVAMAESILDLNTRVLNSPQKTTIKRADFEIIGDTARFDTAARQGTVTGNVKMTITDASKFSRQNPQ
jgi:lipopolysaccharide export system protein LptC